MTSRSELIEKAAGREMRPHEALQQVEDERWQCETCQAPAEEDERRFCRHCKTYWNDCASDLWDDPISPSREGE